MARTWSVERTARLELDEDGGLRFLVVLAEKLVFRNDDQHAGIG